MRHRVFVLGPEKGWHASQLSDAAKRHEACLRFATYESLSSASRTGEVSLLSEAGNLLEQDAILTRTMPAASMERLTFRLSMLHLIADGLFARPPILVNSPRCLEWCIDKSAATTRIAAAGFRTPPTRFVQSRREAMDAFRELGGDCILKPVFGGEGRGVMRVQDPELAWYATGVLDQLDAVIQIQAFIPPGGIDLRLLFIGERCFAMRRRNANSFRTNVAAGSRVEIVSPDEQILNDARSISDQLDLTFGAIDLIEAEDDPPYFLEVNAVPGWKAAQSVVKKSIAGCLIETLVARIEESC
ncbi:MAG: ATP-grasp domain-containing protein [Planctomycetota bacterium]